MTEHLLLPCKDRWSAAELTQRNTLIGRALQREVGCKRAAGSADERKPPDRLCRCSSGKSPSLISFWHNGVTAPCRRRVTLVVGNPPELASQKQLYEWWNMVHFMYLCATFFWGKFLSESLEQTANKDQTAAKISAPELV